VPVDGNYRVAVSAIGVYDVFATPLASGIDAPFYVLGGDANRNRTVDFNDLVLLARNFGQSPRTFSQGDFNYDGKVDFNDLVILARNFNRTLSAPPSPAPPAPTFAPVFAMTQSRSRKNELLLS